VTCAGEDEHTQRTYFPVYLSHHVPLLPSQQEAL
jgi:hypothetical protein